jgi:hypothetical protein
MLREKISAAVESNIQKAANRKTALPAEIESAAVIRGVDFADGGAGRLWLNIAGEVNLSEERLRDAAKSLTGEGAR